MVRKPNFFAVILAGGSGERFWPLSTNARPKQFLNVFGGRSLIRQAADRLEGLVPPERILVITAASLVKATRAELPFVPKENIVGEPCRRDTAAAVAVACGLVKARGGADAVCAILTADQIMKDVPAFRRVLSDAAVAAAKTPNIVTMGVTPDRPATGFGYIEKGRSASLPVRTAFAQAVRFVEKPDLATAKKYLKSGRYVWNAGMFVWRASVMESAFAEHTPHLAELAQAVAAAKKPESVLRRRYPDLPKISIDYAVMEKTRAILVASGDFGWDDVGTWAAAEAHLPLDEAHNAVSGSATLLDAADSVFVSTGAPIAALGVSGLVVVSTPEAVLVMPKSRAQDLKSLLKKIAPK